MISTADGDPYIIYDMIEGSADDNPYGKINKWMETRRLCVAIVLCILIDIIAVVAIKHIRALVALPVELWNNRQLIWGLSKNDFKTRFAGSYLGIVWAFIQPVVTVVVYWFVFTKGMRAGNMSNYPYILYLMTGLVPWFYFSEAWNGGTNSLLEYNYLVKKVVFKISILPMVKVISSIFVHMFFIAFIVVLSWCYGYTPSIYTLQIFYYVICSMILVLGLSYITCSVAVFFRDLTQIINIILQIGIWVTPIMWDPTNTLSNKWQIVLKLNPMCYIVNGFRNSLLGRQFFWNDLIWTLYFWIVVLLIFVIGVSVFKKLRVHFADVL
jgi:teichoic acid transport system permease protein